MALPRGVPSETKQGPEDTCGQFNEGMSPGGGGSAQSLERRTAEWGRAEVPPACPTPALGAPGNNTLPSLPPPAKPPVGQTHGGRTCWSRMRRAPGGAQGGPAGAGLPPQIPLFPAHHVGLSLCGVGGFADASSVWFREKSDGCGTLTCSPTRRGSCSYSTRGTSSACRRP